jgi:hypothetical protein
VEGTGKIVVPTAARAFVTSLEREVRATTGRK